MSATTEVKTLRRLLKRLMVEICPCIVCSFRFATHAKFDPVFGFGQAKLCRRCVHVQGMDEDWRPLPREQYTSLLRQCFQILAPRYCPFCGKSFHLRCPSKRRR